MYTDLKRGYCETCVYTVTMCDTNIFIKIQVYFLTIPSFIFKASLYFESEFMLPLKQRKQSSKHMGKSKELEMGCAEF